MRSELLQQLKPYSGKKILVTRYQGTNDIVKELVKAHADNAAEYDKIVDKFWTGNEKRTLRKLFDYCKSNIKYEIEPDHDQTIKTPSAIIAQGKGDCKHYASFCNGIISAINRKYGTNMNNVFRFAGYNIGATEPQHVYCAVRLSNGKETIVLDPVLEMYNNEKPYTYIKDNKAMSLSKVSGLGANVFQTGSARVFAQTKKPLTLAQKLAKQQSDENAKRANPALAYNNLPEPLKTYFKEGLNLMKNFNSGKIPNGKSLEGWIADVLFNSGFRAKADALKDYWLKIGRFKKDEKNILQKIEEGARNYFLTVSLVPQRNAFLALVKLNTFGLAIKLARFWNEGNRNKIENFWVNTMAGTSSALQNAIRDGIKHYNYYNQKNEASIKGIGGEPVSTAALITAAAPVVTAVLNLLGEKNAAQTVQQGAQVYNAANTGYQDIKQNKPIYEIYEDVSPYFSDSEAQNVTEAMTAAVGAVVTTAAATRAANILSKPASLQALKVNLTQKNIEPVVKAALVEMVDKRIFDVDSQKQRNPKELRFEDQKKRLPNIPIVNDKSLRFADEKNKLPGDKSRFEEQKFATPVTFLSPSEQQQRFVATMDDNGNVEIKQSTEEEIISDKPNYKPLLLIGGGLAALYFLTK